MEYKDYTVKNAMESGEKNDDYGVEYFVRFEESEYSFKMWFKKEPKNGDIIKGAVEVGGKYGPKFKKAPYTPPVKTTDSNGKQAPRYGAQQADKNDGMRQGMCMNNAAAYVASFNVSMNPREWSKSVFDYASALYSRGDLKQVDLTEANTNNTTAVRVDDIAEAPTNVQEAFGIRA